MIGGSAMKISPYQMLLEAWASFFWPNFSRFETQQGASFLCDMIVAYILEQNGYRRPSYNRLRNEGINFEVHERHFCVM
jgi:hypothetical protein